MSNSDDDADALVASALNGDGDALKELLESGALDELDLQDDQDAVDQEESDGEALVPSGNQVSHPIRPLSIEVAEGEHSRDVASKTAIRPTLQAAVTTQRFLHSSRLLHEDVDLPGLINALEEQIEQTKSRDLSHAEAMLTAQAHTLDAIFNQLARKAAGSQYLNQFEAHMKMALRTQSQCRATLQTISDIQNPRVAGYVNQANIAHNQQVNNGSRTEETQISPNELLEANTHEADEWLDPGTPSEATRGDTAVETVEAVNGAENRRRQGQS